VQVYGTERGKMMRWPAARENSRAVHRHPPPRWRQVTTFRHAEFDRRFFRNELKEALAPDQAIDTSNCGKVGAAREHKEDSDRNQELLPELHDNIKFECPLANGR